MKGLQIPVGVDRRGGLAWVDGEANDDKTIRMALSDCSNNHAFLQDFGLGIGMIFDPLDYAVRAKILKRLREIFADFETRDRYRLLGETISWEEGDGTLTLSFRYLNLETDEVSEFRRNFASKKEG